MHSSSLEHLDFDRIVRALLFVLLGGTLLVFRHFMIGSLVTNRVGLRVLVASPLLMGLGIHEMVETYFTYKQRNDRAGTPAHSEHRASHHNHAAHHSLRLWPLLLPLLLLPLVPRISATSVVSIRPFTVSTVRAGGTESSEPGQVSQPESLPTTSPVGAAQNEPAPVQTTRSQSTSALSDVLSIGFDEGVTEFNNETFAELTQQAFETPFAVAGKRVRLTGFVFREEVWPPNVFVAGRLAIYCCAADAQFVGLLVEGGGTAPKSGDWVRVDGTLGVLDEIETLSGPIADVPILRDATIAPAAPPEIEYVLPALPW